MRNIMVDYDDITIYGFSITDIGVLIGKAKTNHPEWFDKKGNIKH